MGHRTLDYADLLDPPAQRMRHLQDTASAWQSSNDDKSARGASYATGRHSRGIVTGARPPITFQRPSSGMR
jgi:hypothetical protein